MKKHILLTNQFTYFTIFTIFFVLFTYSSVFATNLDEFNLSQHTQHEFGDWTIIQEATTEMEGYRKHSCLVCTATEFEEIPKLVSGNPAEPVLHHEHIFDIWINYNSFQHVHSCECGHSEYGFHEFGDWTIVQEATTESEGYKQRYCIFCTINQFEEIPKLVSENPAELHHEHIFDEWINYNSFQHARSCECGHFEYENHKFGDWTIVQEATTEMEGAKKRSCTICTISEFEEIPKLTSENPAETKEDVEESTEESNEESSIEESSEIPSSEVETEESFSTESDIEKSTEEMEESTTSELDSIENINPISPDSDSSFIQDNLPLLISIILCLAIGLILIILVTKKR